MDKNALFLLINQHFAILPDHLFEKNPEFAVFRHLRNKKWFALYMEVPASKFGQQVEEIWPILNLKLNPELIELLRTQPGYYPAYHMNKRYWLSIHLTKITVADLLPLIEESYYLTKEKKKK